MKGIRRSAPTAPFGAAVAAVGIIALGGASAGASSAPTLSASKHAAGLAAVTWGKPIKLSGHETLGGTRSFVLQAEEWPFTSGFKTVASGTTTGGYSVTVKPVHPTRYRLYIKTSAGGQGPTSPVVTVYTIEREVSFSCNLCVKGNTAGKHTLVINATFQAPPGPIANHGPAYFYYALNHSSVEPTTLQLVKKVARQFSGNHFSFTITYQVTFPSGLFTFGDDFCWKDAESKDGFGLPGHHHCGQKTIKRGKYLG